MSRGAFIVFEGADRTGKTTQTRNFTKVLLDLAIPVAENAPWRFPDRTTPTGTIINQYLKNQTNIDDNVLHLLFSANRWEKASQIRKALQQGQTVILDRYAYSGVAYSLAKGLPFDWCKAADQGLPAPDLVIYLHLNLVAASKRGSYGSERYENNKMQKSVIDAFERLRTDDWVIIDADADEKTVLDRITKIALPKVKEAVKHHAIASLW